MVYLRGHEGRGIGLVAKLQAYALQDEGRDTVDANLDLGLPADARHYGAASQVLRDLGVTHVRLLTNNPEKSESLEDFGIHVDDPGAAHAAAEQAQPGLPAHQARPDGSQPPGADPVTVPTTGVRPVSGHGAPVDEPVDCSDLRVGVVAAQWHTEVMDGLVEGARRALAAYAVARRHRGPGARHVRAAGRGRAQLAR